MACTGEFITASGSNTTYFTYTLSSPVIEIDWSKLTVCGLFETPEDYRNFISELHVTEFRKDTFRHETISLPNRYSQKRFTRFVPTSKNFKGVESRRL